MNLDQSTAALAPEPGDDFDAALSDVARVYRLGFAAGLRPDAELSVAEWAAKYRVVPPESSAFPGAWDPGLVPFLNEIMACLAPSHPWEVVTFKKSAQVAGSEAGLNWLGSIIDVTPGPAMIVQATIDAGKAWVKEKLNETIEQTPRLREFLERKDHGRSRPNCGEA